MTEDRSETETLDPRLSIGGNNPPPDFSLLKDIEELPARLALAHENRMKLIIDAIAERANKAPTQFASDEDLANATDIVTAAADAWDEFDAKRIEAKDPYKRGVDIVDGFYRDPLARLKRIKEAFGERATKYNRDKKAKADAAAEAERLRQKQIADAARAAAEAAAAFDDHAEVETHTAAAKTAEARIEETYTPPAAKAEPVRGSEGGAARTKKEWTFEILDFEKVDLNALRLFIAPEAIEKALKQLAKNQKQNAKVQGVRFFEDEKAAFSRR